MATWNAEAYVAEQVKSILGQIGADVRLIASDDMSTDGTLPLLCRIGDAAPGKLTLLPAAAHRFGNANRNFIRLICESDAGTADFVALADHDDVWELDRLRHATDCITRSGLDAYSSDVIAFWPDGRERLVRKSWPQRRFDYLFESAGPGCTFVLSRHAFDELQQWLRQRSEAAGAAKVHDWLIYAFARRRGWRWLIDQRPTLRYRQHGRNEIGANAGWSAMKARLRSVYSGGYLREVQVIADLVDDDSWVAYAIRRFSLFDRLRLMMGAGHLRRRPLEQLLLVLFLATMRGRDLHQR
jgi:rhamnosyltransferase